VSLEMGKVETVSGETVTTTSSVIHHANVLEQAYTFSSIFFDEVCLSLISHLTTEKAASTKAARSELTKQLKLAFNDASFVLLPPVGGEEEITNVISSENIP
ncbi:hypothetical protein PRIPAC_93011, partial [Pristionchus pacificus]|uniref:Uncharacterized protein n=1 Tax=Pristionchus pacificus TaxID=54126 RepID=A0A2A6BBH4_PRIPA